MSAEQELHVARILAVLGHPEEVQIGLPWAVAFARRTGVPLSLVHIVDPVMTAEIVENAVAMAKDMLALLQTSATVAGLTVEARVETGLPEMVIPQLARAADGTVLLLTAGEHGTFARSLLRRGRENVIHHVKTPFVLLPPRIGTPHQIDRVVLGRDGSTLAGQAGQIASMLCPGSASLEVEVLEPGALPVDEYLAFTPRFSPGRIQMRGRAGIALLSAARSMDAGMIAVGGHGTTGLRGRHLGGTAQWLSHNADRPLLVVPR